MAELADAIVESGRQTLIAAARTVGIDNKNNDTLVKAKIARNFMVCRENHRHSQIQSAFSCFVDM